MKATCILVVVTCCLAVGVSRPAECQSPAAGSDGSLTEYQLKRGLAFSDFILSKQASNTASSKSSSGIGASAVDVESQKKVAAIRGETERMLAEIKKFEDEIKAFEVKVAEQEEMAKLAIDFAKDEPQVRHYLSALFADGYSQPDPATRSAHKQTAVFGPVSLIALKEFSALEPSERGLLRLGHAGSDPTNDRGRQAFPKNIGGSLDRSETEFLYPAQRLLIKYQKLLVMKGLLAP
ncbi:MAG: hypothetical protein SFV81_07045 [Pirellulaceae bacterium]|nr:hypothetical protein [Pirellulaceae bacterium]